jgi:hypothetical protein
MSDPQQPTEQPVPTYEQVLEHHQRNLTNSMLGQLRMLRCTVDSSKLPLDMQTELWRESAELTFLLEPPQQGAPDVQPTDSGR